MSHYVGYETFDKNVDRAVVYDFIEEVCAMENGDGYGTTIKWHCEKVYADYEEAKSAITRMDNGWYDDHAVLYYNRDAVQPTKAMQAVEDRIKAVRQKRDDYAEKFHVKHRNADFIGCKMCGSKLKREYLRSNKCPLCGSDLRSDSVIKKLGEYEVKLDDLGNKYRELAKKQPGTVKWLVKYEFHC